MFFNLKSSLQFKPWTTHSKLSHDIFVILMNDLSLFSSRLKGCWSIPFLEAIIFWSFTRRVCQAFFPNLVCDKLPFESHWTSVCSTRLVSGPSAFIDFLQLGPGTKKFVNRVRSCKICEESWCESWQDVFLGSCLESYLVSFFQALTRRSCKNSSKILWD